jgi:glutamate-1-semialdehyde 2,1-aminomutase
VVKFQGCYHGWHDAVAMNVISTADKVGVKDPLSKGILPEILDATIVLPFNDTEAVARELEVRGEEIAAIILEPVPHNIGAVLPNPGFLETLRELCTRHGVVLVFDEVITGFRHRLGGYQAVAVVSPDLTALGKAMANGDPISALGGRADLMELFSTTPGRPAFFAGTFNGHPAVAAAALATIQKLEQEPVHEHVSRLGERTRRDLRALRPARGARGRQRLRLRIRRLLHGGSGRELRRPAPQRRRPLRRLPARADAPRHLRAAAQPQAEHFSYAHREEDVDHLLEATEKAVLALLTRRGS